MRTNPTPAEAKLWQVLRKRQLINARFRRQHPIPPYIVDFCAPRLKLVIEVDGGQHLDQAEYDQYRSDYLEEKGYRVLRFWNNQVMNDLDSVVLTIINTIGEINRK
jgi:very-short-patch-repair endonuclease